MLQHVYANFTMQEIAALDLYCGCGGLSFIDGVYAEDGVEIQTKWAVDYNESCCASFQANYPEAQVCVWVLYHAMLRQSPSSTFWMLLQLLCRSVQYQCTLLTTTGCGPCEPCSEP
jgi:site-specific DNA-cytosine methylase